MSIVKEMLSDNAWMQCTKPNIHPKEFDSGLGESVSRSGDGYTDKDSGSISSVKTSKSKLSHTTGKVRKLIFFGGGICFKLNQALTCFTHLAVT